MSAKPRTRKTNGASRSNRTLAFGPETLRLIGVTREHTEATSEAEVIRRAVRYYARAVAESIEGARLIFRRADGREVEYLMPDGPGAL